MAKFTTLEEKDSLIKSFEEKAKTLTESRKGKVGVEDPEVKTIITTEWDEGENPISGEVYVIYVNQPHILSCSEILDLVASKGKFTAGMKAWDIMIDKANSSPEFNQGKYKLGAAPNLPFMINMQFPDLKKN